jgi:hypothetical protein
LTEQKRTLSKIAKKAKTQKKKRVDFGQEPVNAPPQTTQSKKKTKKRPRRKERVQFNPEKEGTQ